MNAPENYMNEEAIKHVMKDKRDAYYFFSESCK